MINLDLLRFQSLRHLYQVYWYLCDETVKLTFSISLLKLLLCFANSCLNTHHLSFNLNETLLH